MDTRVGTFGYEVVSNEVVGDGLYRMVIGSEVAETLEVGQFVNMRVPGNPAHIVRTPLSFASSDRVGGTVELVYAVVGDATRRLSGLGAGETCDLVGPCGKGWRIDACVGRADQGPVLVVAGGIGATPIVAAARALREQDLLVYAVLGAQTAGKLWGVEELSSIGCQVLVTTDDGTAGEKGFTVGPVERLLSERTFSTVLTCGPTPMMAGVARLAAQADLPCQASLERMMTCGFGACHTCNVALVGGGYAFCCTDGPVFDAKEVAW